MGYGSIKLPQYSKFSDGDRDAYLAGVGLVVAANRQLPWFFLDKPYLKICKDFIENKLGLDEFSCVSSYLWIRKLNDEHKFTEFGEFLMGNGELGWNLRHPTQNGCINNVIRSIINFIESKEM